MHIVLYRYIARAGTAASAVNIATSSHLFYQRNAPAWRTRSIRRNKPSRKKAKTPPKNWSIHDRRHKPTIIANMNCTRISNIHINTANDICQLYHQHCYSEPTHHPTSCQ